MQATPIKKPPMTIILLAAIIVALTVGIVLLLIFIKNQATPVRGIAPLVTIQAMEPDSAEWGKNFPNQYSTLLQTADNKTRTTYGGSEQIQKIEADPRLVTLFAGNAFSKDYKDDRGHQNALIDVRATLRLSDKTPGTCYSCKSSDNPKLWANMGMEAYDKTPFSEMTKQINNPIGCANCHEANTMRLIVTNPALDTALKAQGKDWHTFTRQEMRTIVCANCHVEYYFQGDGKLLTFPWKYGTTIDDIEKFYTENGFVDWTHTTSGASMIKMQHPDYELFSASSTHYNAGVSCADCHMPYIRDGAVKFSTHNVKSPLLDPNTSCGACHTDVDYVVERAKIIQNQVYTTMISTEDALVAAIETIATSAKDPKADPAKIEEARKLHRSAQMRWDFIAAENSMGFHNPTETLRILASATDLARQAQLKAIQALQTGK